MLKYDDIIKRMSDSEKIRILCDIRSLSDKNYRAKGIPELREESIESLGKGEFPSPGALSNTWDISLIREVASQLSERAAKSADLLSVPAPRVRINPYRTALSEDPLMAGTVAAEYLKAASRARVSACVGDFGLHADEVEFLDREPNERFLREFLMKPYAETLSGVKCSALITMSDLADGPYRDVNGMLCAEARRSDEFGGAAPVCGHVSAEETVKALVSGKLFFDGSSLAVESALSRYRNMERAVRQGQETEQALAEEISSGRAISPDQLDAATDRLLELVFSMKHKQSLSDFTEDPELASLAVRESLVLLKNDGGILPFETPRKIALIGDAAFMENKDGERCIDVLERMLKAQGQDVIGKARGYEWNKTRNEDLIEPAVSLANDADAVILFLGNGEMRAKRTRFTRRVSLPANQAALLDALCLNREKIIAVLPSEELWDMEMPENCRAILTLPWYTAQSCSALAETLTGEWNPCGKLANTVYTHTDDLYADRRTRCERDGMKTGVFLGYRNYVTSGEDVGFPFGHGLSYTEFAYTDMRIDRRTAFVTVQNVGKREGEETVQLYVAKTDSAVLRPAWELAGFARIRLKPGAKGVVQIPFVLPEVYARELGGSVTESGSYTVYAGASCVDLRLFDTLEEVGKQVSFDGEKLGDYIHTKSNIITDNYKLEAKGRNMKRSVFNWVAGAAAIVMAIVMKLYCLSDGTANPFFDWFELILCALGVGLFIAEASYRSKLRESEKAFLDQQNEILFEDAEQIPQYEAANMFVREFERSDDAIPEDREVRSETFGNEYFANIDRERTFDVVAGEFEIFAKERGCKLRADSAKKIFAALASSRLVVFSGLDQQSFQVLMHLMSDYLETGLFIDRADASYVGGESVLYRTDAHGNKVRTDVFRAIESARGIPGSIHLAGISDVRSGDVASYFAPFMHYIKHPLSNVSVRIVNDMHVETFHHIPQNLWFMLNLASGEAPDRIPEDIACAAVVDMPVFDICPESEWHTQTKGFGYYQLEYLKEKLSAEQSPDESLWRKIDRLEDSVRRIADCEIDNKHWIGLENFVYAYMACGGSAYEAIDSAVAARLIVPMMSAWCAADGGEREFEDLVENVFGDDHGEACRKLIKVCIESHV